MLDSVNILEYHVEIWDTQLQWFLDSIFWLMVCQEGFVLRLLTVHGLNITLKYGIHTVVNTISKL